jgi:UDP-N-acetylmuramyl pentapeptide phosphotransferase/UDP-N-acetylglucosamine-1-phosphate transferase
MRHYVSSTNRAAVRWCGGLGILVAAAGIGLIVAGEERSVPFDAGIIAVIVALVLLGIAGYAWLDDVVDARNLRRRGRRGRSVP